MPVGAPGGDWCASDGRVSRDGAGVCDVRRDTRGYPRSGGRPVGGEGPARDGGLRVQEAGADADRGRRVVGVRRGGSEMKHDGFWTRNCVIPVGKHGYVQKFATEWLKWTLGPGDTGRAHTHGVIGPDGYFMEAVKETSRYGPAADEDWERYFGPTVKPHKKKVANADVVQRSLPSLVPIQLPQRGKHKTLSSTMKRSILALANKVERYGMHGHNVFAYEWVGKQKFRPDVDDLEEHAKNIGPPGAIVYRTIDQDNALASGVDDEWIVGVTLIHPDFPVFPNGQSISRSKNHSMLIEWPPHF